MNKKADKLFSAWQFLIFILVGISIVGIVFIYYGADLDVRDIEVEILNSKLSSCVLDNSYLFFDFVEGKNELDIFKVCNLKQEVFQGDIDFYFKLNFEEGGVSKEIAEGVYTIDADCKIKELVRAENLAVCHETSFSISRGLKKISVTILSASNQRGEKIYD